MTLNELDPSIYVCVSLSMSLGQIVADIYEAQGLAFVEASATFLTNELLPLVKKTVADTKVRGFKNKTCPFWMNNIPILANSLVCQAHISFSPTLEQQKKCPGCEGTIIDGDFIIKYDVMRGESLGEVQVCSWHRRDSFHLHQNWWTMKNSDSALL